MGAVLAAEAEERALMRKEEDYTEVYMHATANERCWLVVIRSGNRFLRFANWKQEHLDEAEAAYKHYQDVLALSWGAS